VIPRDIISGSEVKTMISGSL